MTKCQFDSGRLHLPAAIDNYTVSGNQWAIDIMSDNFMKDLHQAHDSLLSEKAVMQERLSRLEDTIELVAKAIEVASISDETRKETESFFDRLLIGELSKLTLEDALVQWRERMEGS